MTDTDAPYPWRARRARDTREFASPAVRALAARTRTDPAALRGTGAGGRVTRDDLLAASSAEAPPPAGERVPFNTVRRRAASLLVGSKRAAPHALCVVECDYSAIEAARAGEGLTYLPFVARAVCDALRAFPAMNAVVGDDGVTLHGRVHLGIAVDLDHQGLVVPVVRDADGYRLRALAGAIRTVAQGARARALGPDDYAGGTFTITNPGAAGTWMSFPILNQAQAGILSTDGVAKRVVADDDGRLRVAPVGRLCLTFDHRAVDPPYAARFLDAVRAAVEARDWPAEL